MDRRTVLRSVGAGIVAATAGCLGGEVVHDVQREVRIDPGSFWISRMPGVGGSGAISYTARAEARFDVYVFTERAAFERYESYFENRSAPETPTGRDGLGTTAVFEDGRDRYAATTGDGGARQSFDTNAESYFVVDHSGYGMGAEPGQRAEALSVFVDLEVVDKQFSL